MNYKRLYDSIIGKAYKRDKLIGYKEKHHIIPRSLGGSDKKENIVNLTAREHFICHYLLTKMYEYDSIAYYKMLNAFIMMKCSSANQNRYFNSKLYESSKEDLSAARSKNQTGKGNTQFGTIWVYNLTLKQSKKIKPSELDAWLAEGWLKGRKMNFNPEVKKPKKCKKCGRQQCLRPEVCKKHQMVNTLVDFFGMDKDTFDTDEFYDEYDRVVSRINGQYHDEKMSTLEIAEKYGISTQRLDSIFKSVGIKSRTFKEALRNYVDKQEV